jgi:RNA polymerase sigma factor (sigma-70 family)
MTQLLHKTGATETTATLYESHHRRIRGYCLGQLRDSEEANDAMQSTFLYAFAALQRGMAPRNELPWLFTIAHNVCRTRRRSLLRRSRLEAAIDIDSLCDSVGRDDPSHEDLDALGSSLAALPENQRRALLLREWQGLSYAEVAARMGLTESAVEAVIFRARRSLAEKLRAANRVASLVGAVCFLPLRRLGSVAGTAKVAAATLAVGLVAGTAIEPLVHSHGQGSPTSRHAGGIRQPPAQRTAGTATVETLRIGHTTHRAKTPVAATRYSARTAATPPAAAAGPPAGSAQQPPAAGSDASEPPRAEATAVAGPQADATTRTPSEPAARDPVRKVVADIPAGQPTADVKPPLPPQLQDVLSNVPLPTPAADSVQAPSLPSPVQSALDDVQNAAPPSPAVPSAPEVPNVPAAPAQAPSALPSLPPLPNPPVAPSSLTDSPTQGTPLQASP